MSTTTATAKRSDCARRTAHSLDELAGYVVVQTLGAGCVSLGENGSGPVLAVVEGSTNYLQALAIAKAARVGGAYAVVRDLSDCPVCDPIVRAGRVPHFELPA